MKLFLVKTADLKTSFTIPTEATADVSLRRLQKLKVAPGATVRDLLVALAAADEELVLEAVGGVHRLRAGG
mgnify:CR=1 FL=1